MEEPRRIDKELEDEITKEAEGFNKWLHTIDKEATMERIKVSGFVAVALSALLARESPELIPPALTGALFKVTKTSILLGLYLSTKKSSEPPIAFNEFKSHF